MAYCTNCGHELATVGRFCTNCGQAVDAAAPPASPLPTTPPPTTPPPTTPPPAGSTSRYPLWADEVAPPPPPPPPPPPVEPVDPGEPAQPPLHHSHQPPPRTWLPWATVAVAVVLVAVSVVVALNWASGDRTRSPDAADATGAPAAGNRGGGDLTSRATVTVPATAPPNQDTAGNRTTYAGANMLDGVPETCWRMPGDGTGSEITVTLPEETHLAQVGMVNGYAKTAEDGQGRELDWYHGNRRVLSVQWVFDDGTTVAQDLAETTDLQTVDVDVTTTTVVLRLVEVSAPGTGPAARDFTAISDLAFIRR